MRLILKTNSNARASSGRKHQFRATQRAENKISTGGNLSVLFHSRSADWRQKHRNFRARCVFLTHPYFSSYIAKGTFARINDFVHDFVNVNRLSPRANRRIEIPRMTESRATMKTLESLMRVILYIRILACTFLRTPWERNQVVLEVCSIKYLPIL